MSILSGVRRLFRLRFLGVGLGLFAVGCQAPPASTVNPGSVQRLATIPILDEPHKLLEGPVYPELETRHILRWRANSFEWEITLTGAPASYAAVMLKKPLDLRAYHPKSFLRFRVRSDSAARNLYIGLADSPRNGSLSVMVQAPMDRYRVWRRNAEGYYVIPLQDFGPRGRVLSDEGPRLPTEAEGPMDWGRVSEFRIGTLASKPTWQSFLITHLQIGSNVQVSEKKVPPVTSGSKPALRRGAGP